MTKEEREKAIKVLDDMKVKIDIPKATVMQHDKNWALDCAIKVLKQEPKTGHWIKEESVYGWDGKSYQCSVCGRSIHLDVAVEDLEDYPYCHCGAKMESEE